MLSTNGKTISDDTAVNKHIQNALKKRDKEKLNVRDVWLYSWVCLGARIHSMQLFLVHQLVPDSILADRIKPKTMKTTIFLSLIFWQQNTPLAYNTYKERIDLKVPLQRERDWERKREGVREGYNRDVNKYAQKITVCMMYKWWCLRYKQSEKTAKQKKWKNGVLVVPNVENKIAK